MKRRIVVIMALALIISACSSTGPDIPMHKVPSDIYERVSVDDIDDIRTTISVNGRLCTLTLSAVTGEKSIIVEDGKRYRTYDLSELPASDNGSRYLYSTSGNINIILKGSRIYISIETEWAETYIERDYLSPFIFATHA